MLSKVYVSHFLDTAISNAGSNTIVPVSYTHLMLRIWNRYGALWPALCAVLISLLPYVTFDTAYVLHSGNLLVPDLTMSIGGCAVSYAGFVTGTIVRTTQKV